MTSKTRLRTSLIDSICPATSFWSPAHLDSLVDTSLVAEAGEDGERLERRKDADSAVASSHRSRASKQAPVEISSAELAATSDRGDFRQSSVSVAINHVRYMTGPVASIQGPSLCYISGNFSSQCSDMSTHHWAQYTKAAHEP